MQAKPKVAVLMTALGLVACASGMHWEHPETGQLNLTEDDAECRQLAAAEGWRTAPTFSLHYGYGFGYGRHWSWWNDPFYDHDLYLREMELRDFCLRSRGYRLVPDAPAK
jgi:hypothetical protein